MESKYLIKPTIVPEDEEISISSLTKKTTMRLHFKMLTFFNSGYKYSGYPQDVEKYNTK
jgi:hypothetical protein